MPHSSERVRERFRQAAARILLRLETDLSGGGITEPTGRGVQFSLGAARLGREPEGLQELLLRGVELLRRGGLWLRGRQLDVRSEVRDIPVHQFADFIEYSAAFHVRLQGGFTGNARPQFDLKL